MADPITWYLLPRKVDDPTTIEEYIQQKILEHNLDPSAHGQADEAIFQHRMAEVLDHVNYSIYNIKLFPQQRPIKAFVDAGGAAEFSDIQTAIDYVHSLGGGKIFVKAGTYYPSTDLTLYSDIQLEGEDDDTTIIDFGSTTRKLKIEGTETDYKKNIEIRNLQFRNQTNSEDGAIRIQYGQDILIEGCYFTNIHQSPYNTAYCIKAGHGNRIKIERCRFYDVDFSYYQGWGQNITFENNEIENTMNIAVFVEDINYVKIVNNYFKDINTEGILLAGMYGQALIAGNSFDNVVEIAMDIIYSQLVNIANNSVNTGGYGIWAYQGDYLLAQNNHFTGLTNAGILLEETNYASIIGNNLRNIDGSGVSIAISCNRTMVVGNHIYPNVRTPIANSGTNTLIANNITS